MPPERASNFSGSMSKAFAPQRPCFFHGNVANSLPLQTDRPSLHQTNKGCEPNPRFPELNVRTISGLFPRLFWLQRMPRCPKGHLYFF